MKNFKIFFTVLGVAFLVACGGANESSKKGMDKEQGNEEIVEKPKDSLTLAAERKAEEAAIEKRWMNDQEKMGDLFDELGLTSKQINRYVIENRNSLNAWKEENPDEFMTLFERRANRDRVMHNILNPTQMNEYLHWTQRIDPNE